MQHRKILAAIFACLLSAHGGVSRKTGWVRLRSGQFDVLTNAGPATAQRTLRQLEEIRRVFEGQSQTVRLAPLPVRAYVFGSEQDFQPFRVNAVAAGYYRPARDRDYIAM